MLNVYRSNRLERLAAELAQILKEPVGPPTEPEWIAVQSQGMRSWLELELLAPERLGIWCNVWLPFPRGLIGAIFERALGVDPATTIGFAPETLVWTILGVLPGLLDRREFEPLRRYLVDDPRGVKRYQLAIQIARAFDEYALYRSELVLAWERDEPRGDWQPVLWNAVVDRLAGHEHVARMFGRFREQVTSGVPHWSELPRRITLFGVSSLPPMYLQALACLPANIDVNLFLFSPSREYWADIGKRVPRGAQLDLDELELHLDVGNPLLATLGRLGQHFQATLESGAEYLEPAGDLYTEPRDGDQASLLHSVQDDVLALRHRRAGAAEPDARPRVVRPDDDSITVHSCHSPLREVEVLRDRLLALFDDEGLDLYPHDVLVLSPSIETYAPYVEAVFGAGESKDDPSIPYRIVGRSVRRQAPVIDAFLSLLALARGRVGLREVLDLLAAEPVRDRFDLGDGDVERAQQWAEQAGVRWGIDREHRERHGQPALEENTWRFGLDRLLLGYAVPDGERLVLDRVVPFPEIEGSAAEVLGGLVEFGEVLMRELPKLDAALPITGWSDLLTHALEQLFDRSSGRADEHALIAETLRSMVDEAAVAGLTEAVDLDVMRDELGARLDRSKLSRYRASGAVTVGELLPLRGIPGKVICLLGLDDQVFPRTGNPPGFDLMSQQPRVGDRSPRNDDRYLFLETLLAARERLIVTYVGQDIQSNRVLPPSVLVAELLDALDEGYRLPDAGPDARPVPVRDRVLVEHPLQPFSRQYFERTDRRDERLFSYAGSYLPGVRALLAGGRPPAPFFDEDEPLDIAVDLSHLRLDDLTRFYGLPCEQLLGKGLGVYFAEGAAAGEEDDREPFELDHLEQFVIGSSLLDRAIAGGDLVDHYPVERGKGRLPLGTVGRRAYGELVDQAQPIADEHRRVREAEPLDPLEVDIELVTSLGATRLVGVLDGMTAAARVQLSFGKNKPKRLLDLWIRHLALGCMARDGYPRSSLWIGRSKGGIDRIELAPVEDDPRGLLARLVELYWIGQQRPLRFFPTASQAYAKKMLSPHGKQRETPEQTEKQATANARSAFESGPWNQHADETNPAVQRFFGGRSPIEDTAVEPPELGFKPLALEIYGPLFRHLGKWGMA